MFSVAVSEKIKSAAEEKVRHGKTQKDHGKHASKKNRSNQEERHNWINESRGDFRAKSAFPLHTCGGKGNSSVAVKMVHGQRTRVHKERAVRV